MTKPTNYFAPLDDESKARCPACLESFERCNCSKWCSECRCITNHSSHYPPPGAEDEMIDDEELSHRAFDADIESRIAREREREDEHD